jgi:predicted ATPase
VLDTVAVETYRSLRRLVVTLRGCNVVTGPNGSGKLSDGTLRYLLWAAALLTPRPAELTVLNEPEASLHPDLLPALAGLITHAARLVTALSARQREVNIIELTKTVGETGIVGQGLLDEPSWHWPARG